MDEEGRMIAGLVSRLPTLPLLRGDDAPTDVHHATLATPTLATPLSTPPPAPTDPHPHPNMYVGT